VHNHKLNESPLAGYTTRGVDNARLSTGIAGIAGVSITLAIAGGLAIAVRRRRAERRP
jgi:hypothetical protein